MKNQIGVPLEGFAEFSRKVASEGVVLLKNQGNLLPFQETDNIAIFGRCQIEYYRSGTGSGGAVSTLYNSNILDSFPKAMVNAPLAETYRKFIEENPFDNGGGGWACEPWSQKELELSSEHVFTARKTSDKALVVIGRTAGEDKDNLDVSGSYRLTDLEEKMLEEVCKEFSQVVVLLNISNIIDLSWTEKYPISSLVISWNGGMEGGAGTVDVLLGKVTVSGKLPDTIARAVEDYSSSKNHGGVEKNVYQEDIYVGYRYFETFAPEKVLYPFGFGLSYTEFSLTDSKLTDLGDYSYELTVKVKNIGEKYSGKEVVQVYLNPPQGLLGKATRNLVGFAKTALLAPQEESTLTIAIPKSRLLSFDDSGVTGARNAYVLEAGTYEFYVGTDVKAKEKHTITVDALHVAEQYTEALAPKEAFQRMKPVEGKDGVYALAYEDVPTMTVDMAERITQNLPKELPLTGDKGIKLADVKNGKATLEDLVAQFTTDELCALVCGEGMSHPHVTSGTASAFCGVTEDLRHYGLPLVCCADGPSGIRMEGGLKSTQVPIGTLQAATWDVPLIEELYGYTGEEMRRNFVDVLLGPGMNIHRHPLNGRNFEYFSEDPLLTGMMAAAVTKGIGKAAVSATLKHFACNSQETYRHSIDSVVSQRAAREIYLKAFEIAVKEGGAQSIMTAYNPINGIWTASNYDLNTTILRKEWGYTGFVMTDWWARMNDPVEGGEGLRGKQGEMVKAQNDVYMVLNNFDAKNYRKVTNLQEHLDTGKLTIGELQACALNICGFAMNNAVMNRDFALMAEPKTFQGVSGTEANYTLSQAENILKVTDNKQFTFLCPETATYAFSVDFNLETTELAQIFFGLKLNEEMASVMLTGLTRGEIVRKKLCELELTQGTFTVDFQLGCDTFWVDSLILEKL